MDLLYNLFLQLTRFSLTQRVARSVCGSSVLIIKIHWLYTLTEHASTVYCRMDIGPTLTSRYSGDILLFVVMGYHGRVCFFNGLHLDNGFFYRTLHRDWYLLYANYNINCPVAYYRLHIAHNVPVQHKTVV